MGKGTHSFVRLLLMIILALTVTFAVNSRTEAASTYKIRINKQQNCVTVYKLEKGKYKAYKAMPCSAGWATPLGKFSVRDKIRWHELDGPVYGQYCSRITTHILFHSVWYYVRNNPATLSNYQYNKLGTTASHGCVRLCVADSKWIYDNCPMGTPIEIYNSEDPGPLGKPAAIKLPDGRGWDPTDTTNPSNPYNKKKPVIKLKRGNPKKVNVAYASELNLKDAVTAKNTTGFDCIDRVKYKIEYKVKGAPKYKKVKKVNTRKAGIYKVTYSVKDEIGRKDKLVVKYVVNTKVMMTQMAINKNSKTLYLGGSESEASCKLKLKTCKPAKASIKELQYWSDNPAVASVDKDGKVTAIAPGKATISALAKDGSGLKDYCVITVKKYASSVKASVPKMKLAVGESVNITKSISPGDATGKDVSYSFTSSNANVAVVDTSGRITGVSPGTAVITVTARGAAKNKELTTTINIIITGGQEPTPAPTPGEVSSSAVTIQ